MEIEKIFFLLLIAILLEDVVHTQLSNKIGNEREIHEGQRYPLKVENILMDGLPSGNENLKNLIFHPNTLNFLKTPVGDPKRVQITLLNQHSNQSVFLGMITGNRADFYSSFFEDKIIPPGGNTTFNVVFLPRHQGLIDGYLSVHTSFGLKKYDLRGMGIECPYRLKPLVGIKVPFNATISPEILMYNPHDTPIQIVEVFSSGGNFHLELPSGEQEGPQILWEIPPFCTKKIIQIKFNANIVGNQTTYIRIKITGKLPELDYRIIIIPIEIETQPQTGIYASIPFLDFGLVMTNNLPPRQYHFNLLNSNSENDFDQIYVHNVQLLLYNLDDLDDNTSHLNQDDYAQTLIPFEYNNKTNEIVLRLINWPTILRTKMVYGHLLINTTVNVLRLPCAVYFRKGELEFSDSIIKFIHHKDDNSRSNLKETIRKFSIKNNQNQTLVITNLTISANHDNFFLFKPIITMPYKLYHGLTIVIFHITERSIETTGSTSNKFNNKSKITIHTNFSDFEIPVVKTDGFLKRIVPIENNVLPTGIDEKMINFGTLPVSKSSDIYLALVNENPIPVKIIGWQGTISSAASIHITLCGCSRSGDFQNFRFCNVLLDGTWIVYHISVSSNSVGSYTGKFIVQTDYEEIITPVKFVIAMGRLELDNELLYFRNCFPDGQCSLNLSAHSTYLKKMKVESITADVPGVTYEFSEQKNDLPEISPNEVTNIGRLAFNSREFCKVKNECYTGLNLSDDNKIGMKWKTSVLNENLNFIQNSKLDLEILMKQLNKYESLRNDLKNITFRLATNQIRKNDFNARIEFIWPRFIPDTIEFSVLQVGHEVIKFISFYNPSNELVVLHYMLHDDAIHGTDVLLPVPAISNCDNCTITQDNVFSFLIQKQEKYKDIVNPKSFGKIVLVFSPKLTGTYSTVLYIRNNLTIVEGVWITARAVQPQFKFANRKPGSVTPLLFEITDKHLRECSRKNSKNVGIFVSAIRRTFTARNVGEVPIVVGRIKINGEICEGYGFKILDCSSFELSPNTSRKIEIAFTPDFTLARVTQLLEIETSLGTSVNYTILGTVPFHFLELCGNTLLRPYWEEITKKCSSIILSVLIVLVIVGAFLDADRVLNEHVNNLSKDRGLVQPPLDLRHIGLKSNISSNYNWSLSTSTSTALPATKKRTNGKRQTEIVRTADEIGNINKSHMKIWTTVREHVTAKVLSSAKVATSLYTSKSIKKRRSVTPPSKSIPDGTKNITIETEDTISCDLIYPSEEECCSSTEDSFTSEDSLPFDNEKLLSSKSSSTVSHHSILSTYKSDQHDNSLNAKNKASKIAVKKTRSLPNTYLSMKDDGSTSKIKRMSKINIEPIVSDIISATNRSKNNSLFDSGLPKNARATDIKKSYAVHVKKSGKTPNRGRKMFSKKSTAMKSTTIFGGDSNKTNGFPFNNPSSTKSAFQNDTDNIWDDKRASFSYVVAQQPTTKISTIPSSESIMVHGYSNRRNLYNQNRTFFFDDSNWNDARPPTPQNIIDNKKIPSDATIEMKRSSIDLGPIGTRKSPSSTPVWEPMGPSIRRPKPLSNSYVNGDHNHLSRPLVSQPFNNSIFNFAQNPVNSTNQMNLNANQSPRTWDSGAMLLSMLQREPETSRTDNLNFNSWGGSCSSLWAPVDYPVTPSNTGWPQGPLRPPPGLTIRDKIQENQGSSQISDQNFNVPQYDPFSSVGIIWSPECWSSSATSTSNNDTANVKNNISNNQI